MINKDFGKYTIEKELGKGGMATVYLGVHKDLGRQVALKVMHPHLASDADARTRFETEAKAIAKLEHVNILQIYDFGGFENNFYIAMELIDGKDAEKLLKENGPLPPEITGIIFCGISNGLHQAHLHGIIHRDIKLSNIIVKADGLAKLSDFGIVKMEDSAALTHSNSIVGTPYYIAPEQVEGAKASTRSDIYALGVSMYYAITGRYPFKAETLPMVLNAISMGKCTPLNETGIYVPPELAVVVERCMQRDPKARYDNALLIAQDLNSFLNKKQVANDAATVANYLGNPKNFAQELRENSTRLKFDRAKTFKEKDLVFEALQEYEAILQEDPGNKEVQQEIARLGDVRLSRSKTNLEMETMVVPRNRKKGPVIIALSMLLVLLAAAFVFLRQEKSGRKETSSAQWKDSVFASMRDSMATAAATVVHQEAQTQVQAQDSARKAESVAEAKPRKAAKAVLSGTRAPAAAVSKAASAPAAAPVAVPAPSVAATAPPACTGYLFVFSELWGTVYLDDKKVGSAPTKNKLETPCGDYMLRIENPGGKVYTEQVKITGGETLKRQIKESDFK